METLNKLLQIDGNYILIGLIVIFFTVENLLNNQFKVNKTRKHLLENIGFQVIIMVFSFFWATVIVNSILWLNNHKIGLFYFISIPIWLKLIVGVMIFDFAIYCFHRTAHRVPVLWRFHRVHHSDSRMDASSNMRVHPIEMVFFFGSSGIIAAAIFGLDALSLQVYYFVITPWVFLEHSNLKYPGWVDKTFGLIFYTPNFHKVHHDRDQFYTDSNYADIFVLWDRLFGTFKYKPPDEVQLGLKEFEDDKKQSFWYLMILPFLNVKRTSSDELNNSVMESNQNENI